MHSLYRSCSVQYLSISASCFSRTNAPLRKPVWRGHRVFRIFKSWRSSKMPAQLIEYQYMDSFDSTRYNSDSDGAPKLIFFSLPHVFHLSLYLDICSTKFVLERRFDYHRTEVLCRLLGWHSESVSYLSTSRKRAHCQIKFFSFTICTSSRMARPHLIISLVSLANYGIIHSNSCGWNKNCPCLSRLWFEALWSPSKSALRAVSTSTSRGGVSVVRRSAAVAVNAWCWWPIRA